MWCEIVSGRKYYGKWGVKSVLLVNGCPEFQGTYAECKKIMESLKDKKEI